MNKHKFLVFGLSAVLFATSCRKNDVQAPAETKTTETAAVQASEWKTASKWSSESEGQYTVYSTAVTDANLTSAIAGKGLVLVYRKTGNDVAALPLEEKANGGSYFWYYQVSEGNVTLLADAYGSVAAPGAAQSFKYFIVSAEKLSELEGKGYSRAELMRLSYENAATILK